MSKGRAVGAVQSTEAAKGEESLYWWVGHATQVTLV